MKTDSFSIQIDDQSHYGTYNPKGSVKFLLALMRHSFLGRGLLRRWALNRLNALTSNPIDYEINGFSGRFYITGNDCEIKSLVSPKVYNRTELEAVVERITPESVFVDIGANVGLYSLFAASKSSKQAKILAIEPHPTTYRRLEYNVFVNDYTQIIPRNIAIGDCKGRAVLNFNADQIGTSSLVEHAAGVHAVEVEVCPLLDLLQELQFDHIDILKIDVEGYEDRVLVPFFENASKHIWPKFVIIEYIGQDQWQKNCLTVMQNIGYREVFKTRNNIGLELT